MVRWSGLLVVALVMGWSAPVAARQETPEAGPDAVRFFPEASVFGDGWSQIDQRGVQVPSDIFRQGAVVTYAGPIGARIVVISLLQTDTRVAVRQSWEEATKTFDQYRYSWASNSDYELGQRLEAMEPPAGCVEAKRAEGSDREFGFTAGITMCALDPDVILLAGVSGTLGEEAGYAASDLVIAEALAAAGA